MQARGRVLGRPCVAVRRTRLTIVDAPTEVDAEDCPSCLFSISVRFFRVCVVRTMLNCQFFGFCMASVLWLLWRLCQFLPVVSQFTSLSQYLPVSTGFYPSLPIFARIFGISPSFIDFQDRTGSVHHILAVGQCYARPTTSYP